MYGWSCDQYRDQLYRVDWQSASRTRKSIKIETLSLYFNHLEGTIQAELGKLSVLETLILHNTDLMGSLPPDLGDLASLRKLDLDSNQLSGEISLELTNCEN